MALSFEFCTDPYSVQVCCYVAPGIDCGLFPAQLDDLANETDGPVREGVEVGEVDAGGGDCFGHG